MEYFDRYKNLRKNGVIKKMPHIKIKRRETDKYIIFNKQQDRLDNISYRFYNSPDFAWLILLSNPEYGGWEFLFNDGIELRIPYPLESVLEEYNNKCK